jgi:hypothetical protein
VRRPDSLAQARLQAGHVAVHEAVDGVLQVRLLQVHDEWQLLVPQRVRAHVDEDVLPSAMQAPHRNESRRQFLTWNSGSSSRAASSVRLEPAARSATLDGTPPGVARSPPLLLFDEVAGMLLWICRAWQHAVVDRL